MPETPDFEKLAREYFINYVGDPIAPLAEQLRQIWNARGAADIETLAPFPGANLHDEIREIKKLDR